MALPKTIGKITRIVGGNNITVSERDGIATVNQTAGSDGTVTSVSVGTGLDIANATTTPSITLNLSELTDGTADVVGSADELIYLDDGTQKRKLISEVKLGQFNNDQNWTSNAGDVTLSGIQTLTGRKTINTSFPQLSFTDDSNTDYIQIGLSGDTYYHKTSDTGINFGWRDNSNNDVLSIDTSAQTLTIGESSQETFTLKVGDNGRMNMPQRGLEFENAHGYFSPLGDMFLPLFINGSQTDLIRFQTPITFEYWNHIAGAWADDMSNVGDLQKLLDGRRSTSHSLTNTKRKFRFVIERESTWADDHLFYIENTWSSIGTWTSSASGGGSLTPTMTVERLDGSFDASDDSNNDWTTNSGITTDWHTTGIWYTFGMGMHYSTGMHNAEKHIRITVDFPEFGDATKTIGLKNIGIISSYSSANSNRNPLVQDFNRNMTGYGILNLTSGHEYRIDNTSVLGSTTLGSGVVNSSLTNVGTLTGLALSGALTTTSTIDGRDIATDGSKLDGIASGAEVNVQSDWNASSGDAQILNKPTIPSGNAILDWTADQGGTNIHSGNYTNTTYSEATGSAEGLMSIAHHDKLDGISAGANVGLASTGGTVTGAVTIHTATDAMLNFKASDDSWSYIQFLQNDGDRIAYIGTDGDQDRLILNATENGAAEIEINTTTVDMNAALNISGNIVTAGTIDGRDVAADGTKLDGIASGAEVNVQSDWNSSSGDNQILNKPTIPSGNAIIDWTSDQGATNIHSGNYTNTTYSVGDGGLTTNDFTNADHTKLNGIEASADVTDTANVLSALSGDLGGDFTIGNQSDDTATFKGSVEVWSAETEAYHYPLVVRNPYNNETNLDYGVGIKLKLDDGSENKWAGIIYEADSAWGNSGDLCFYIDGYTNTSPKLKLQHEGGLTLTHGGWNGMVINNSANTNGSHLELKNTERRFQLAVRSNSFDIRDVTASDTSRFSINSSGNITIGGTIDGRDLATDGTKLDGIEASATADQTQADINGLGITSVGTITNGTWEGDAVESDYIGALTTANIISGTFDNARISASSVQQHTPAIDWTTSTGGYFIANDTTPRTQSWQADDSWGNSVSMIANGMTGVTTVNYSDVYGGIWVAPVASKVTKCNMVVRNLSYADDLTIKLWAVNPADRVVTLLFDHDITIPNTSSVVAVNESISVNNIIGEGYVLLATMEKQATTGSSRSYFTWTVSGTYG